MVLTVVVTGIVASLALGAVLFHASQSRKAVRVLARSRRRR